MDALPPTTQPNNRLRALLADAGWGADALARRINAAGTRDGRVIHVKTPYKWLSRGEVPHGDIPDLVVGLLSRALDTDLTYEDVWGVEPRRPPAALPADHEMDLPWTGTGLLSTLGDLVPTRRTFIALTGAALTGPAWAALQHPAPALVAADGGSVTPPLLTMIDAVVSHAQQLDDQQGGGAHRFVVDQFVAVSRLLRRSAYDVATGRHLAAALAQLGQTAGWMAFDAGDDGRAQRWYLTALRAAHAAEDKGISASILALMSNQAADRGYALDALQLASAAQEAATGTPAAVRSLVAARSSLAHAAAGDLAGFCRMHDDTLELLGTARNEELPTWASYIDRVELDAITGRGMVVLAQHVSVRRQSLLEQAMELLHARAHTDPSAPPQRSALRHGAWLVCRS
ncbi:hypothetical protein ACFP2T_39580 [Plantactinospora solaniradicis]|uniref:Transcriptional regulator n=2 Tax=Plantactinospora solaniradicis TaxID=1723736 RepID=A0ABW1KLS6_9ACTN